MPETPSSVSASELSDGDLARRVVDAAARAPSATPDGEASASEAELYRRFARRVRLYGRRHLRDPEAAEDLVQHTLLLTLQKLRRGEVRQPERIASFVLGIARLATLERRREGRRWGALAEPLESQLADGSAAAPPLRLDAPKLRACLDLLPPRPRAVVLASYYAERSSAEVAAELGTSPGNVRVVRHRALRELRECMGLDPHPGSRTGSRAGSPRIPERGSDDGA